MFCKNTIIRPFTLNRVCKYYFRSNTSVDIEKLEKDNALVDVVDDGAKLREEAIQLSRNKSRLKVHDRNLLHEQNPFPVETCSYQGTLRYKRKLYGRYGKDSGVDPSICWPTEDELKNSLEYERVAYPFTIPEMIKTAQEARNIKNEETQKRQQEMIVKLSKLEGWKRDMEMRIAKKESEAMKARQRRERLIEEVTKHFGYKVDPKDDKFKELLEKKEKEQKKLDKEARKKEKEAKLMEKLKVKKKDKGETVAPVETKQVQEDQ